MRATNAGLMLFGFLAYRYRQGVDIIPMGKYSLLDVKKIVIS